MAGVFTVLRLRRNFSSFSSSSSSSSSSSIFHSSPNTYTSSILFILTLLSLSLAAFAFILQWRGGLPDPRWVSDVGEFPGSVLSDPESLNSEGILGRSRKLSFPYFRDWKINFASSDHLPKICITTSTSAGLEQTLPWIFYHKVIGITRFFMFVEGKAASPNASNVLESIPGVTVIHRTRELEEQQAKSRIWNESWMGDVLYKPCNYELFSKQTLNMEMAIVMAREAGMDWIFHLDTDELIHPAGTSQYSVQELLYDIPADIDNVVFANYESSVERDDIREPFSEVSLFKKNRDHVTDEAFMKYIEETPHRTSTYFLTYANGKSAARVQEHLRPNGAHRWYNYVKTPSEVRFYEAVILHYTYTKFSDLTSRRDRCGCKPTKEDVQRCFFLDFDRDAFIIASTATEEEMRYWYNEKVVWKDEEIKNKLMMSGIFTRIYSPMVITKHLRESGVFSSVISEAWAKKKNASGHETFWETYTRKFGRLFESKKTAIS